MVSLALQKRDHLLKIGEMLTHPALDVLDVPPPGQRPAGQRIAFPPQVDDERADASDVSFLSSHEGLPRFFDVIRPGSRQCNCSAGPPAVSLSGLSSYTAITLP